VYVEIRKSKYFVGLFSGFTNNFDKAP